MQARSSALQSTSEKVGNAATEQLRQRDRDSHLDIEVATSITE